MTDTTTTIDTDRIVDLIHQYHQTESRAEQREIENDVLAETVWQEPPTEADDEFSISGDNVELIYSELPEEALEAKRVLRALYID
jgi:hypothetical protein